MNTKQLQPLLAIFHQSELQRPAVEVWVLAPWSEGEAITRGNRSMRFDQLIVLEEPALLPIVYPPTPEERAPLRP